MKNISRVRAGVIIVFGIGLLSGVVSGYSRGASIAPVSPGCHPIDSIAYGIRDELIDVMGRSDALANGILSWTGVVRVAPTQIAIVSDAVTCGRAAEAYSVAIETPVPDRHVHAIRAGIRYVVIDPTSRAGEYMIGVTFDSSFTQVHEKFAY